MTESAASLPALPLATDQRTDAAEQLDLDALEGLSEQAQDFLGALAAVGGSSGNGRLLGLLGWDAERYEAVKAGLMAAGQVVPGRGRGGSVLLAEPGAGGSGGAAASAASAPAAGNGRGRAK
ncbi:MAG: hypothetical protein ACKOPS_01705, partial [Cyanobium sp.]